MRLGRCAYEIPGVARGEVWLRGPVLLHHDLTLLHVAPRDDVPVGAEPVGAGGEGARRRRPGAASSLSADARDARRTKSPNGGDGPPLRIEPDDVSRQWIDLVTDLCRRFREHLLGRPVDYLDIEIDLDGRTDLQLSLADALRRVPWGETVTYGELAALAGRPGAARAAGGFCADSTWSLVMPAHRVVAAGGIGGFGASGSAVKRHLLALEGVEAAAAHASARAEGAA